MHLKTKGFSLIELSLVLTLIGFMIFSFLPKYGFYNKASINIDITYKKLNEIHKAIALFKQKYNRMPCPANLAASEYSIYSYASRNIAYDDERIVFGLSGLECNITIGALPTAALGLDPDYMFDGFGNKFTYRVSDPLCGSSDCNPNNYYNNDGNLTIKDGESGSTIISNAAYAIISHGENGAYAYLRSGARSSITSSSTDEQRNGNYTATGTSSNIYIARALSSDFRNIVQYRTKSQIDNMFVNNQIKLFTEQQCIDNSNWLNAITQNIASDIRNNANINTKMYNYMIPSPDNEYNYNDEAALDILWTMQEICATYYTITKKCPGGGTYNSAINSCYCANGNWNGSC